MKVRLPLLPSAARWSAVLAVAGFIFYVSLLTAPPRTPIDRVRLLPLDKWRHLVAYGALGGALAYALEGHVEDTRRAAASVLVATLAYGIGIELGQYALPQRYFSPGDAVANATGVVLSLGWYRLRRYVELVPARSFILERFE